ncbi:hypothetical protein D3C79_827510 [compost metagenome]
MPAQQLCDEEKVLHQAEPRAAVAIADQPWHPRTPPGCFAGVDQFFEGPVIHAVALGQATLHAQLLFQRIELFTFGEQQALGALQRCAYPLGTGGLLDQSFEGLPGVCGNGGLKMQGGAAMAQGMGIFVLPDL